MGVTKTKIYRTIAWIVLNAILLICGIMGFTLGVEGAKNLFMFLFWLSFVLSFSYLNDKMRYDVQKRGRSVPRIVSVLVDFTIICMLAINARFIMATCWLIQMGMEEYGFTTPAKCEEKNES